MLLGNEGPLQSQTLMFLGCFVRLHPQHKTRHRRQSDKVELGSFSALADILKKAVFKMSSWQESDENITPPLNDK